MEIPIYIDYQLFRENYKNDLQKFINTYPICDEIDFLFELKKCYEETLIVFSNPVNVPKIKKYMLGLFTSLSETTIVFNGIEINTEIERKTALFNIRKILLDIYPKNNQKSKIELIPQKEIFETPKSLKTKLTTPEKIALLEHLGIFAKLHKDGVSAENEYRIIENLIGGSNIKKYCLNRRNSNKSYPNEYKITEEHREKAKNFYNSKTL